MFQKLRNGYIYIFFLISLLHLQQVNSSVSKVNILSMNLALGHTMDCKDSAVCK